MGDTRNIHTGLICSVSETDNTLRSLYSFPRRPGPSRRQQSNCKRRNKTVSTEPWHARVYAMLKWHDIITLQILFLRGIYWWRKVEKTFCFPPRGWVLLVLKIHQENKVLGVYKFLNEFIQPVFSYTRASLSAESKKYTWGSPISDITKIEAAKRLSGIRTMFIYSQFCKALSRLRRDIFRYLHKGRKHTFRIKHSPFNLISDSQLPIS